MTEEQTRRAHILTQIEQLLGDMAGEPFGYPMTMIDTPYLRYGQAYGSGVFKGKPHPGVDFTGPVGSLVFAVGDGIVTVARNDPGGYGYYVMVKHQLAVPNEVYAWTLYAHLTGIKWAVGTKLHKNAVIGTQGTTGNSGGVPHLHFEVKRTDELSLYSKLNYSTLHRYFYDTYTVLDRMHYVPI